MEGGLLPHLSQQVMAHRSKSPLNFLISVSGVLGPTLSFTSSWHCSTHLPWWSGPPPPPPPPPHHPTPPPPSAPLEGVLDVLQLLLHRLLSPLGGGLAGLHAPVVVVVCW